jgi:RNA polymerase sigma factor (sigma-70 family)
MSEASVVARAATGDRAAFTQLVAAHHPDMLRLAGVIVGDPEIARDAVQSAWQRAWTGLRRVRDHGRIRPWLLSIAANEARQILRRRRPTEDMPDELLAGLSDPVDHFDDLDLRAALDRLDARDRELLGLRYVLGFNSVELATQFGLSPEGVRGRLKKLIDRLRSELTDD